MLLLVAALCLLFQGKAAPAEDNTAVTATATAQDGPWFPFEPGDDPFSAESKLDLRFLNERVAGEEGFIIAREGRFVHATSGKPVRFWAVNGPPHDIQDPAQLRKTARMLAKRGVNLVRVHGGMFDKNGEVDLAKVRHAQAIVEAMKSEGIYTHFSIYFPLWFSPAASLDWIPGYDGNKKPFAALQFNKAFQDKYRSWWQALLLTPAEGTGRKLIDEPAVFGVELQNEDSFFFWTFSEANIPEPELVMLEGMFGDWLKRKYGSLEKALETWKAGPLKRDRPAEGRMAFRPLWNLFSEKTARDQDTVRFLYETQAEFYAHHRDFLRDLGFKGVVTASNWATASPEVFGPLEKMSYTTCDFIDRHGYFSCNHKGPNAEWSIRDGHTYSDRSALRFDPESGAGAKTGAGAGTGAKQFVHPSIDPKYDGKPSMISETTFNRPNRYRSEAPIYYAVYGALQGSDAIVHFALDGARWDAKPGYFMQPWTLMSPAMMGQSPATALLYRQGLVSEGAVLARVDLNREDLFHLKGTPMPQDAAFDELRLKDVPTGDRVLPGQRIDPLIHWAGRTEVRFTDGPSATKLADLSALVRRKDQLVSSSTRELRLDYGKGLLTIDSDRAQGASGDLASGGIIELSQVGIKSAMSLGHILIVPLDGQTFAKSRSLLVQVMSEEKATGFKSEPQESASSPTATSSTKTATAAATTRRILSIGQSPWLFRGVEATLRFKRQDAANLRVRALDLNGYPVRDIGKANSFQLEPATVYYWIGDS